VSTKGSYTTLDVPGSFSNDGIVGGFSANGINVSGQIVGWYHDAGLLATPVS
jgi:hypothetical protein